MRLTQFLVRLLVASVTTFTVATGVGYIVGEVWLQPHTQRHSGILDIRPRSDGMRTIQPVAASLLSYAPSDAVSGTLQGTEQARARPSGIDAQPATPLIVVQVADAATTLPMALAEPAVATSSSGVSRTISVVPEPIERFHIQLGSFAEQAEARALFLALRDRGYAAHLIGGPPYVVWVGGYLDEFTAKRLEATLRIAGFEPTLVR